MKKTYLVQSWNADGSLANNYEVSIENDRELADLKKFLKGKFGHVLVTHVRDKKPLKPAAGAPFRKHK